MARYIDADELIRLLVTNAVRRGDHFTIRDAMRCVKAIDTADVAPKNEVARGILSDLKKKIHDRAVYTGSRDIPNYIDLKTLDAIIDKIANGVG